ncbi:MAG: right-handed parallel beta-helix repeat-containing protein [Candidatus Thermoplasmatota archaeon]|nr:right-handed parallel beta-helix repeat-containing protein [Euryarchaeota archaeon]MBU4032719.1 right-handed parallel beta-helix repeat-containing protein [Candidatus Thermoplasmatota archaeon]MBU4071300.1 right-handed parallel beta-helix repeat-containing protein [Candidatus Thermoplasmatota archaeon]MBU4143405.1 right-handed parallel beta-helix repeat-containing protein [Candidatus Thermoplasmatota archaeon]MBU4592204.1 right-handed parallel beta-helix repeat-containing protein [Candidatus
MFEVCGVENKGALILEESAESVKKRKWDTFKMIGGFLTLFSIMFIIDIYSTITTESGDMDIILLGTYITSIVMMFVFAFFLIRSVKPFRFYENGIEINQPFQKNILMPYSDFERIDPPQWYRPKFYGFVLKKKVLGIHPKLPISTNIDGLSEKIDIIASRIANPPVSNIIWPVPTTDSRRRLLLLEIALYTLTYIFWFALSFIMGTQEAPPGTNLAIMGFSLAIVGAIFPIFLLMVAQLPLKLAKHSEKFRSDRLFIPGFSAILIFCMISSPIAFILFSNEGEPTLNPDPGAPPSFSVLPMRNYSDTTLHPTGDILVDNALFLENVTLVMEDNAQIWVTESGELRIHGSILRSNGTFKFRSFGILELNNTSITNLWGYVYWPTESGGIEVFGGNAIITNTTITGSASRSLMISDCRALIANCTISNTEWEGIVLVNSPSVIRGNTIQGTETGILVWDSTGVMIEENTFSNNSVGVSLTSSEATIRNNTFIDNSDSGIDYDTVSTPTISNNTFQNNFLDTSEFEDFPMLICGIIVIVESIIVMGILMYQSKKLKAK